MTQPVLADLQRWGAKRSEDEARAYIDPRDLVDGKLPADAPRYPSVTSVLRLVDKSSLIQWAVNLAVEWCVNNLDALMSRSVEAGIKSGKYRWKDYRNERASVGDGIHATIEAEHLGTWSFPVLDEEQSQIIDQWRDLNTRHVIKPIYSEMTVFDTDRGYAGTLDGIWEIDGKVCLVDIKTSKSTWPEHWYQLGALWQAPTWMITTDDETWTAVSPSQVDRVAIVHLRSDFAEIIYEDDMSLMQHYANVFNGYLGTKNALDTLAAYEKKMKPSGF